MKNSLFYFATLLVITTSSFAQTKNFIDQPYLETNAKVDTLVTPDHIYLSILINETDTKGKTSVEELENAMAKKLVSLGINLDKQLTLADLSSNFKKYFLRKQDVVKAKSFSLLVYNAVTAGKVLAGLEEIGISNVDIEKVEYSKMDDLLLALKSKAVKKAKLTAIALTKPLNQKVGNAIYISDARTNNYMLNEKSAIMVKGMSAMKDEKFNPIQVDFEKIKVTAEVTVTFKIE